MVGSLLFLLVNAEASFYVQYTAGFLKSQHPIPEFGKLFGSMAQE